MKFPISDFRFQILAAIAIAALFPYSTFAAGKKEGAVEPAPSFVATVNGHSISVHFVYGKFDPKKRVVTRRPQKASTGGTYEHVLVNGRPVFGTDNNAPTDRETIEKIVLRWDGKLVPVPESLYDFVVAPHNGTNLDEGGVVFVPDPRGTAIAILMDVGDGGGSDRIVWMLRKDGKHRRLDGTFLFFPHSAFIAEKKERAAEAAPSFVATVNGHSISVQFLYGKFDPKKRVVTRRPQKASTGETYEQVLVNGRPVFGSDNNAPAPDRETIEKIVLRWDGKLVPVPESLYDFVVAPHNGTNLDEGGVVFVPDPRGTAIAILMDVGDGGGSDRIVWMLRKDGKHRRLSSSFLDFGN